MTCLYWGPLTEDGRTWNGKCGHDQGHDGDHAFKSRHWFNRPVKSPMNDDDLFWSGSGS